MYGFGKRTADEYKTMRIFELKDRGYLEKNSRKSGTLRRVRGGKETSSIGIEVSMIGEKPYVRVHFTQTDRYTKEKSDFDYKIYLTSTPCNFGGSRWWFVCPSSGKRCGVLYLQSNGYFACRNILNLAYDTQNVSKKWRTFERLLRKQKEADELYSTIKYKYRKGQPTRKYRKYLKLSNEADGRKIQSMFNGLYGKYL